MKDNDDTITVYIHPDEDTSAYPTDLKGDMRVFKGFRYEVQWIFYLMLKGQGLDVRLSSEYPKQGILVIHRGNVQRFVWNPDLFVVSGQWDYFRDDRAQVHLISNHFKATDRSLDLLDRLSFPGHQFYLPPITHPVIIPRNPALGTRFRNVAFIGDPKNLDEQFRTPSFRSKLEAMGLQFMINSDPHRMNDFSDIDAVIAIRKLGQLVSNKPPTKLINAWRGGVPALLGCEIGFREARESEYDFIEVDSVDDVLNGLARLKNDSDFRERMLEQGRRRAVAFSSDEQQKLWGTFFKETVVPLYREWKASPAWKKRTFLTLRKGRYLIRTGTSFFWHQVLKRRTRDFTC